MSLGSLAKRPEGYVYSGHRSYLMDGTAKIIDAPQILDLLGNKKVYERFVLDGMRITTKNTMR